MAEKSFIEKLRIPASRTFVMGITGLLVLSGSAWEHYQPLVSTGLFFVGIFLVAIASLGRLWCSLYIAGYKTKRLITEGPYSMSRNPLYFFSLIGAVGIGFTSETLMVPLLILAAFALYYPYTIKSEEMKLWQIHKDQFDEYTQRTPRFFPKISALKEPSEYPVNPVIFKRHLFSALWFVWAVGFLELIEELHELELLPVLFHIY